MKCYEENALILQQQKHKKDENKSTIYQIETLKNNNIKQKVS